MRSITKLVEIKSPVKVMVFKARQGQPKEDLIGQFQDVLSRHGRYDPVGEPNWLFVGIPGYAEWLAQAGAPEGLNHHVNIVRPGSNPAVIEEQPPDWWAWEPAEGEELAPPPLPATSGLLPAPRVPSAGRLVPLEPLLLEARRLAEEANHLVPFAGAKLMPQGFVRAYEASLRVPGGRPPAEARHLRGRVPPRDLGRTVLADPALRGGHIVY